MTVRSFLVGLVAASLLAAPYAGAQQPVSQPSGSVAAGAYVAGSFADGSSITFGLKADAATCATSNTAMACFRQLHADLIAPLPAGTNAIGSITNTAFGISGTLPAFAATPTFNIGTAPNLTITNTGFNALQGGAANSLSNPFYTAPATGSVQAISGTTTAQNQGYEYKAASPAFANLATGLDGALVGSDAIPAASQVTTTGATYNATTGTVVITANGQSITVDTQGYGGLGLYVSALSNTQINAYSGDLPNFTPNGSNAQEIVYATNAGNLSGSFGFSGTPNYQVTINPSGRYVTLVAITGSSATFNLMLRGQRFPNKTVYVGGMAPLPAGTNAIGSVTNTGFNALQGGAANSPTNLFYGASYLSPTTTNPTSTLTLPSTTTAYASGQLVASSATAGSVVVPSFAIASSAGGAAISRLRLSTNDTTSTAWGGVGLQVDLWLAAPTFTNGDRGTFLPATGTASHLGAFTCTMSAEYGDGAYCEMSPSVGSFALPKIASGTAIYWTLQTTSASGVTGASKAFVVTAELLN